MTNVIHHTNAALAVESSMSATSTDLSPVVVTPAVVVEKSYTHVDNGRLISTAENADIFKADIRDKIDELAIMAAMLLAYKTKKTTLIYKDVTFRHNRKGEMAGYVTYGYICPDGRRSNRTGGYQYTNQPEGRIIIQNPQLNPYIKKLRDSLE